MYPCVPGAYLADAPRLRVRVQTWTHSAKVARIPMSKPVDIFVIVSTIILVIIILVIVFAIVSVTTRWGGDPGLGGRLVEEPPQVGRRCLPSWVA
jgi:hypothetical protein